MADARDKRNTVQVFLWLRKYCAEQHWVRLDYFASTPRGVLAK
jgi:hypothetical protein